MNDLISRQEAIDAVNKNRDSVFHDSVHYEDAVYDISKLPSAQRDSCDGCMWEEAFGYGECYRCKRAFNDMYEVKNEE